MNRNEFLGKLNALYVGDKNCLEELLTTYDEQNKEIERLNNIIKRLENEISGAYTDLSNNLNVNYMHEAFKKDLLKILGDKENGR